MDSDFHRFILDELANPRDPAQAIRRLLERCSDRYPHSIWEQLSQLDYAASVAHLTSWLSNLLSARPPKDKIRILWFGLFHPGWRSEPGLATDVFVEGRVIEEQPKGLLNRINGSFYWPRGRYADCEVVDRIGRLFTPEINRAMPEVRDYALSLSFLTLFVSDFAARSPHLLRGSADQRSLFTQYEALVVKVGTVDAAGFHGEFVWNYWNF